MSIRASQVVQTPPLTHSPYAQSPALQSDGMSSYPGEFGNMKVLGRRGLPRLAMVR